MVEVSFCALTHNETVSRKIIFVLSVSRRNVRLVRVGHRRNSWLIRKIIVIFVRKFLAEVIFEYVDVLGADGL